MGGSTQGIASVAPPGVVSVSASGTTKPKESKWNQRQLRQMAAGGGAGIVAKTVVAPFERVKIVCQTGESVGMLQTTKVSTMRVYAVSGDGAMQRILTLRVLVM